MENNVLLEKWTPLIESKKAKPVKDKEAMALVLENQEKWLFNEESSTALTDIAQYTPIIVPAVRRIFPNLLANEIVGVQPMNGPTGYAYALRYSYEGAKGKLNLNGGAINYPGAPNALDASQVQKPNQDFGSAVLVLTGTVNVVNGADVMIDVDGAGAGAGVKYGTVAYSEVDLGQGLTKVMIDFTGASVATNSTTFKAVLDGLDKGTTTISFGAAAAVIGTGFQVVGYFNNEAGFQLIFKNYIARKTTSDAEYMDRSQMKSMKMSLERFAVETQSRKLKAEYSVELAQDLKNVHGMDAEAELINILEYEISAELDRELCDAIHANCTPAGVWNYGTTGNSVANTVNTADGRWEIEKFRTLYSRIIREANAVALQTRRGSANFIICSLNVASALETLSNFMYSAVPGNVEPQLGVAKIGTLDGRFTVYLDTFATTDFFIVGYKGNSAFDTGIIYCPYVPLQIQRVVNPDNFQPLIGFMTRDAIVGNLWGAERYYRKVKVDFTGSSFISGSYYY